MLSENAKDIHGYEGLYAVTDDGRVYSHSKVVKASHGSTQLRKGRWLKHNHNVNGYKYVCLYKDGAKKNILIHKLVASHFVSGFSEGLQVNHIDGDKYNNSHINLEWVTPSVNISHSYGLEWRGNVKGERNGNSKISNDDVIKIKEMVANGFPQCEVARLFGIHNSKVSRIVNGKAWRHVNG
ncbi:NUMOD4 domain-containing protein [Citrobacter sp. C411]|uniref:NUMOD4 domain-containing protein n=1 Tax=Citrobacter sp. C411 TaxID=3048144 RepID=UPI0039C36C6D